MLPAYRFADEFLGGVVAAMDPKSILVIVSDHGFVWSGGGYNHNPSSKADYPKESPPGVIIIKGDGIRPTRIDGARLFDITPTILYALNEPVAEDMDGRALKEAFEEPLLFGRRQERFVRSYGIGAHRPGDDPPSRAAEEEILEDLRSLGYIGGASKPERPPK
jgi:arylsulfatase A-like enzyme